MHMVLNNKVIFCQAFRNELAHQTSSLRTAASVISKYPLLLHTAMPFIWYKHVGILDPRKLLDINLKPNS